jgi:hypothetical protein
MFLKQLQALFYPWVFDPDWLNDVRVHCPSTTSHLLPRRASKEMTVVDKECVIQIRVPQFLVDALSLILMARPDVK